MKKTIPFMISIIAIASIASITVLGNTQTAYAGNGCSVNPEMFDTGVLAVGASHELFKLITCSELIIDVSPDVSDCGNHRINVSFENDVFNSNIWTADETIENNNSFPGKTTCSVIFEIEFPEGSDSVTQTIMVTTPEPPVVGGEFLPIDSTALVLAGLQTSAIWMLPVLAGVAGSAFGVLYIKSRRN